MAVRLATLRATAELDAQKYVAGARQVDEANKRMTGSQAGVQRSMSQTQARASEGARSFDKFRASLDPVFRAQERVAAGAARIDAAFARGQISVAQHAQLMGTLNARYAQTAAQTNTLTSAYVQLRYAVAALGLSVVAREFVQLSDAAINLESRIRLVAGSAERATVVQRELLDVANRTRVDFEGVVTLYTRLGRSADALGISQERLIAFAETFSQALKISGATTAEASSTVIQLSQALSAGQLRGAELNSVLEQGGRAATALAAGLGRPIGELKKLGEEGQLTADRVISAIESQASVIDAEFKQMRVTVGDSITVFNNKLLEFVGKVDEATGVTRDLTGAVGSLGDRLSDEQTFSSAVANINAIKTAFVETTAAVGGLISAVIRVGEVIAGVAPPETGGVIDRLRTGAIDTLTDIYASTRSTFLSVTDSLLGRDARSVVKTVFNAGNLSGVGEGRDLTSGAASVELSTQRKITEEVAKTNVALGEGGKQRDRAASKAERERKRQEEADVRRANSLTDYINGLEEEARLSGLSVEVRREEEAVLRAMAIVQRFLTEEEEARVRTAVRTVDARKQEAERLEDIRRAQEQFNEDVLGETADTIASLWDGGKDGLEDTLQYWKRRIIAWLSEMTAKLVLQPVIAPILQSAGLGLGALGSSTGGLGANFGATGVGGAGSLGGITTVLGEIGKAVTGVGSSVGAVGSKLGDLAGGLSGATSGFGSIAGGGLGGIGIGATVATLTGGNSVGGAVGGLVGGALGSFLGPIGSLLGGAVGGFLGGLFGGKPTNATAQISFDEFYTRTQVPFSKETAETRAAINNAADQIVGVVQALESVGTVFNDRLTDIAIGVRDPSYAVFASGKTLRSAVGDPNALALTAIKELVRTASFESDTLGTVARRDYGSLEELTAALDFVRNTYDVIANAKPSLTATEQAMKDLTEGLKTARREAERLGLSVAKLDIGARTLFDRDVQDQIRAITDPVGAALAEFERGALARLGVAKQLGADLVAVEKLNALERERVLKQAAASSVASLKGLIDDLSFGGLSVGVSQSEQYFSALSAYNDARRAALDSRTPEAIGEFESYARALVPVASSFLGVSPRYADLREDILSTARTLGTPSVDAQTQAIVAATTQGTSAIVEEVRQHRHETARMSEEWKRFNAMFQGFLNRNFAA